MDYIINDGRDVLGCGENVLYRSKGGFPSADSEFLRREERRIVLETVEALPERDAWIIKLHYGFSFEGNKSLKAIGDLLKRPITRERVRQIEYEILDKLKESLIESGW